MSNGLMNLLMFIAGAAAQCIVAALLQVYRERKQKQQEAQAQLQRLLMEVLSQKKENNNATNDRL